MKTLSSRGIHLFRASLILILIAYSRFMLLPDLFFDQDEVWSVWLASASLDEILGRNPFDSPPGFYIILSIWHFFTGMTPFAMRVFMILLFMLNNAFLFVFTRRLFKGNSAGYLSMLAYSGSGYIIYLSILLRPYLPVMMLFPLVLYLTDLYFDKPDMRRGVLLGLIIAGMWYINLSVIFAYLIMGLYSLFKDWRSILHWILPGVVAFVVALPELWSKFSTVFERTSQVFDANLPPLPIALYERYLDYFGTQAIIWMIVLVIAILLILISKKTKKSHLVWLIIWIIGGPILLYVTHSRTNFFMFARYGWWIAPGFALLIAYGLSALNQNFQFIAGIGLAILLFQPQPIVDYKEPIPDFEASFEWLQQVYGSGDVVIVDPNCQCNRPEVWDYYERVYFPNGLNIVHEESDNQRNIWYFRTIDHEDPILFNKIQESRLAGIFSGSPGFFLQLYTAPPDVEGILFENGLRFHGYEVLNDDTLHIDNAIINKAEGENLRLRLWWSVDEPIEQDYSVGIQVWSEQWGVFAQDDQSPLPIFLQPNLYDYGNPPGTMTAWTPHTYYVEERVISLPYETRLRRTQFTVFMTVYQWWDGIRITADETNEDDLLPLFDFTIVAW